MYDVVIAGFRLNEGETPAKVLERVLGVDAETAKAATARLPSVIVAGATGEQAKKVAAALTAAGAQVQLRSHAGQGAKAAAGAAGSTRQSTARAPAVPPPAPPPRPSQSALKPVPPPAAARKTAPANTNDDGAGGGYQLGDIVAPAPAPASAPEPPKPAPAEAPAPAPTAATAKPAEEADSFSGMQSFGDGFEDYQTDTKALELDDRGGLGQQRVSTTGKAGAKLLNTGSFTGGKGAPAAAYRRTRSFKDRVLDFFADLRDWTVTLVVRTAAVTLVAVITLAAVAFALDPHDMVGAVGLTWVPPTIERMLAGPAPATAPPSALPGANDAKQAPLHPLLAYLPAPARAPLANVLRSQVDGVHPVDAGWVLPSGETASCLIVEGQGDVYKRRHDTLMATGREVDIDEKALSAVESEVDALRFKRNEPKLPLTPVCLAI